MADPNPHLDVTQNPVDPACESFAEDLRTMRARLPVMGPTRDESVPKLRKFGYGLRGYRRS
jgi:hypothetical protein